MPCSPNLLLNGHHVPHSEGALAQDLCPRLVQCLAMPSVAQPRSLKVAVLWKQLLLASHTCSICVLSTSLSSSDAITSRVTFSMFLFASRLW